MQPGTSSQSALTAQVASSTTAVSPLARHQPLLIEYTCLGLLLSLVVGFLGYKQYRLWLFHHRVKTLERLWNLNFPNKTR